MNILKLALLGSLRIAFFGFVKVALCAYTLFLSDTAIAGAARGAFAQRAGGQFEDMPRTSVAVKSSPLNSKGTFMVSFIVRQILSADKLIEDIFGA